MDRFSLSDGDNLSQARMSMAPFELPGSDIQKFGYLKKLKTNKKKFFVLRSTSSSGPARLEYYDHEKKFRVGQLPKRTIQLYKCLNINRKCDTKVKHVIALYLKDECFAVVADEAEFDGWLSLLLEYQQEYKPDDYPYYPHFEYVWQVTVKQKGLGGHKIMHGPYRLCLSKTCISFYRNNTDTEELSFQLPSVRRCGNNDHFFFMEVGRSAPTGSGEIWMQVDDSSIATSMHDIIVGAMKKSEGTNFRQRSGTSSSMASRFRDNEPDLPADMRVRSGSESRSQGSPRRQLESKRPQTMYNTRPPSLMNDPISIFPGTSPLGSPHQYINEGVLGHRFRSDSSESRSSMGPLSADMYGSSPADIIFTGQHRAMTPEVIQPVIQEESSYLQMSPAQRSTSPSPSREKIERPDSACSDHDKTDGYFEMRPGSSVGSSGTDSGYLDMAPGGNLSSTPTGSGYLMMGPVTSRQSAPIPIRSGKEPGGYMEMGPASQPLPTVKEGGSGEAYLPMTPGTSSPHFGDTDNLRPVRAISYLSDDSSIGDFPKRSFSVGSRPPSKSKHRYPKVPDTQQEQYVSDNGRSSSAPHLIVQKMKGHESPYMNESSLSCSPMSHSVRSDMSDTDSLMEMDFYRPRTASDSFGCRPRASSFNKVFNQQRQRSSSYGQQSKLAQLAHDVRKKLGSFESVRTLSKDQPKTTSSSSIGKLSVSSKASSSESIRNASKNSGYVEMHLDKPLTDGYLDMTIGNTQSKEASRRSKVHHSRSSSNQSLGSSSAMSGITSPHRHDSLSPNPSVNIITSSEHTVKRPLVGSSSSHSSHRDSVGSRSSVAARKSPAGSGRESEDESYVPYAPGNVSVSTKDPTRGMTVRDKKDAKGPALDNRKGRSSPKFIQSGKVSPKSTVEQVKARDDSGNNEYMDYEPGSIETSEGVSEAKASRKAPSKESDYIDCSVGTTASSSASESDYVDCDVSQREAPRGGSDPARSISSERSIILTLQSSGDTTASSGKLKQRKNSGERRTSESKLLVGGERKSSLDLTTGSRAKGAKSPVGMEEPTAKMVPSNPQEKQTAGRPVKGGYAYMEYDPANASNSVAETVEEVKTPTRVRSFISSTCMEEDFELLSPAKSAPEKSNSQVSSKMEDKVRKKSEQEKTSSSKKMGKGTEGEVKEITRKKSIEKKDKKAATKSDRVQQENKGDSGTSEGKGKKVDTVVKRVAPVREIPKVEEEDYGYVGLDYGDAAASGHYDPDLIQSPTKAEDQSFRSVPCSRKELKNMFKVPITDEKTPMKIASKRNSGENKMTSNLKADQGLPRKSSVSSLDEMKSEGTGVSQSSVKEKEKSREPLDNRTVLGTGAPELQKQLSMPCMTIPAELLEVKPAVAGAESNGARNRQSCSDLSSPYEQMNLPSTDLSSQKSSSQQQLAPPGEQSVLNYASLDLGSSEDVGNDAKPARIKSRHPSSVSSEDTSPSPFSYAQIDFKMSENLKNANANLSKENPPVKFSLD